MQAPTSRRDLTITKLARCDDGYWTARVSVNGRTVGVDRRYGSWQAEVRAAPHSRDFTRHDVLPGVAAELQKHVRRAERREKAA